MDASLRERASSLLGEEKLVFLPLYYASWLAKSGRAAHSFTSRVRAPGEGFAGCGAAPARQELPE